MKAVIVGGGIGGLAAAVGLRRVGWDVVVCERAPEIREVGAGLSLWSNAVAALDRLGVAGALIERAAPFGVARTVDAAGRTLDELDVAAIGARSGYPSVCAHRADLHHVLLAALPHGTVRTGWACAEVAQDRDAASATAVDGRVERGDVVIGADGIRSVVRAQLFGSTEPRPAGYSAWRAIARFDDAELLSPGLGLFGVGRGCQLGLCRCGGGRVYWFVSVNGPPGALAGIRAHKPHLLAKLAGWPAALRAAVEAADESAILANDIVDRPPTSDWTRGRIALLGDAVHATTPNMGQGACMALEDAVVLADCLRRGAADPAAALAAYADRRRARTAAITTQSRRFGQVYQLANPLLVRLRDWALSWGYSHREAERVLGDVLAYGRELPELPPA